MAIQVIQSPNRVGDELTKEAAGSVVPPQFLLGLPGQNAKGSLVVVLVSCALYMVNELEFAKVFTLPCRTHSGPRSLSLYVPGLLPPSVPCQKTWAGNLFFVFKKIRAQVSWAADSFPGNVRALASSCCILGGD